MAGCVPSEGEHGQRGDQTGAEAEETGGNNGGDFVKNILNRLVNNRQNPNRGVDARSEMLEDELEDVQRSGTRRCDEQKEVIRGAKEAAKKRQRDALRELLISRGKALRFREFMGENKSCEETDVAKWEDRETKRLAAEGATASLKKHISESRDDMLFTSPTSPAGQTEPSGFLRKMMGIEDANHFENEFCRALGLFPFEIGDSLWHVLNTKQQECILEEFLKIETFRDVQKEFLQHAMDEMASDALSMWLRRCLEEHPQKLETFLQKNDIQLGVQKSAAIMNACSHQNEQWDSLLAALCKTAGSGEEEARQHEKVEKICKAYWGG